MAKKKTEKQPKVFCVGINKTGTVSLNYAFEVLGFKSIHDAEHSREQMALLKQGDASAFSEYECYTEGRLWEDIELLVEKFPDANFILTTREKESWIQSRIVHVLSNRVTDDPTKTWRDIDTVAWDAEYDETHERVRKAVPKNRLLEWTTSNQWESLCKFLGKDVPNHTFPHRHTSLHRLKKIQNLITPPADLDKIEAATEGLNWMNRTQAELMKDLFDKYQVRTVLEIGTLHGVGTSYMAEIVRPHGGAVITVDVDKSADYEPNCEATLAKCGLTNATVVRFGTGGEEFLKRHLKHDRFAFDAVYLDDGHQFPMALKHSLMAYAALKSGGLLIMDDIRNKDYPDTGLVWNQVLTRLPGERWRVPCGWGVLQKP